MAEMGAGRQEALLAGEGKWGSEGGGKRDTNI